jgi:hypothetical protein
MLSEAVSGVDDYLHLRPQSFQLLFGLLQKPSEIGYVGLYFVGVFLREIEVVVGVSVLDQQISVSRSLKRGVELSGTIPTFSISMPLFLRNSWVMGLLKRWGILASRFKKKSKNFLRTSMFSASLLP